MRIRFERVKIISKVLKEMQGHSVEIQLQSQVKRPVKSTLAQKERNSIPSLVKWCTK